MKKVYIVVLILLFSSILIAEDYDISAANQAYQNQEYKEAAEEYMTFVNSGVKNFELFYNLGNTYFKLNDIGQARLYYEKAARFDPLHKDLRDNLAMVKANLKDKEISQKTFIETVFEKVFFAFSINLLAILILIVFILLIASIVLLIISKQGALRNFSKILIVILSCIFFIFIVIEIWRVQAFYADDAAVILDETVIAYSGPSQDFPQVFTIHEGLKVTIERFDNEWVLIKLPSGNGGWIIQSSIGVI